MITLDDYFGRMLHIQGPSSEVEANATDLLARVNSLLHECGDIEAAVSPVINSGWRPAIYNASVPNAATRSRHITGQAIDLADPEGELDEWCMDHRYVLERLGLWQEHPLATKNWLHVQSIPPKSGKRVFYP